MTTATTTLPDVAARILDAALVAELTVVGPKGVVTYPLIPLRNGDRIYMTSSVLFSKKLDHIKANPKVAVSVTDPSATPTDEFVRVTIQGDARVLDEDLHDGWLSVLPMWEAKEPVIKRFLRQRFGLPMFFERAVIEIVPRRVLVWPKGNWVEVYDIEGARL